MAIQWYPGHMHKAQKQVKEVLPQVDLVIEVIDARLPYSSLNPMINALSKDLPRIKVFSKTDMADPRLTAAWQNYYADQGIKTLTTSTDDPSRAKQLPDLCRKILPDTNNFKNINAMIMGIPNVGKSTLINIMTGRAITKVGDEPAVTKGQQKINLRNGIMLWDTPGMLWPKVENENSGYRLAISGAIKSTAIEYEDIAFYAMEYLLWAYPDALKTRYGLDVLPETALETLEVIGAKRGCKRAGGRINLHKVSELLINEYRAGQLGPITLETPEMIVDELEVLKQQLWEKAQKKVERKKKFKKR